jgi:hypothetical protein
MAIFKLNPSNFGLVIKLPTHTGLFCVKTLELNISSLGPFTEDVCEAALENWDG